MGLQVIVIPLAIFLLIVYCNGIEGRLVSKSTAVKTIVTAYGDTYDCIDFYKQPAFDHPLLKNHTHNYKIASTPFYSNDSQKGIKQVSIESEGEGCPIGTVPIRRVVESDTSIKKVSNGGYYTAVARKNGTNTYKGASCKFSVHNPKITGQQYSATRMRVQNGPESIEVGWRVDPELYGDNQTRIFVHTDTGQEQCFNTRCGGFILTADKVLLESPLDTSPPPQGVWELTVAVIQDNENNWRLSVSVPPQEVGYWPASIFKGLKDEATYIDWGAEVYDPNPIPKADMGTGFVDLDGAYIRQLTEFITTAQSTDANDIEAFTDNTFYYSNQYYQDGFARRMVVYGGPFN